MGRDEVFGSKRPIAFLVKEASTAGDFSDPLVSEEKLVGWERKDFSDTKVFGG